jgi:NAD(P)H-dependent flavin oxidoreductase YrpB (nitropropane dioxygenase family)
MAENATALCERLGIKYPIIQDGMGPSPTNALAIAVSTAGGLGTVSTPGIMTPGPEVRVLLRERIELVSQGAGGVFAVNVPVGRTADGTMLEATDACISETISIKKEGGPIAEKLVALTTSAGFADDYTGKIKDAGLIHIHKVGSVKHALKAARAGTDIVIASGYEGGGHTHLRPVHTMVLAPQVIAALDIPVIVAGGIYDGKGLAAALAMGGSGISMGTRFIATIEHEWHQNYKQRIVDSPEWGDRIYPGVYAPCRGLDSAALVELEELMKTTPEHEVSLWKEERTMEAQRDGKVEHGLIPAGQNAAAIHDIVAVSDLIQQIVTDAAALLQAAAAQAATFAQNAVASS